MTRIKFALIVALNAIACLIWFALLLASPYAVRVMSELIK